MEAEDLRGVAVEFLNSRHPFRRLVGLAICGMHRVDPGIARYLDDEDPGVRARALRIAGEVGLSDVAPKALSALRDEDEGCRLSAAWSAVLLRNPDAARAILAVAGKEAGPTKQRVFRLAIQAMSIEAAHAWLKNLAQDPASERSLIEGAGLAGDPMYVPWLIGRMPDDRTARLAGEAFSLITGADLTELDLERKPPEDLPSSPNDDPNDSNVTVDHDAGLPWPDTVKIRAWWDVNSNRFPPGMRHFMGSPPSRASCAQVLKEGYQRQRVLAAHYLCLLDPGTPLFNTSAPAWRQQRLLAQFG
ncbi:MAG: TIGR02270 family protein [Steroidobacteraceae bacterium]